MITIYTLKNCDTCKKTIKWLEANNIAYENHDVRADGLTHDTVSAIVQRLGWEAALNKRSTTWRGLSEIDKSDIDNTKAIALIEANPTLLKRPVIVTADKLFAGFGDSVKSNLLE